MTKYLTAALCVYALCLPTFASAQVPGTNDPDYKEIVAYNLTEASLNKVIQAAKSMSVAIQKDPRFQKQSALKAEIKKLESKEDELTEAETARLEKLKQEADELEQSVMPSESTKTLTDMANAIQKEPVLAKALSDAGLAPREFAKFMLSYFQAGMVAGMMKQGLIKEIPKDMAASINMNTVKFVQEHEAQLAELTKAMEGMKTP